MIAGGVSNPAVPPVMARGHPNSFDPHFLYLQLLCYEQGMHQGLAELVAGERLEYPSRWRRLVERDYKGAVQYLNGVLCPFCSRQTKSNTRDHVCHRCDITTDRSWWGVTPPYLVAKLKKLIAYGQNSRDRTWTARSQVRQMFPWLFVQQGTRFIHSFGFFSRCGRGSTRTGEMR